MGTWNLSIINGTNPETTLVGVSVVAPWIFPAILVFEFMVILLSGVGIQSKRLGFSNVPMWGSIAGLVTTTTAIIWSGVSAAIGGTTVSLISLTTLGIWIAITIGFVFWFLFTDLE